MQHKQTVKLITIAFSNANVCRITKLNKQFIEYNIQNGFNLLLKKKEEDILTANSNFKLKICLFMNINKII